MDLCCWAAPALMERRRAGQEENGRKESGEEKVKQRRRTGGGLGREPDSRRILFFLHDTHTNMQEYTKTHTHTHTHTHSRADKTNRKPQTADRISKGLVN